MEEFKKFVGLDENSSEPTPNIFWPVPESEILHAERLIGVRFPETLRQFYQEIGYGFFTQGTENATDDGFLINRLIDPESVADMVVNPASVQRPPEGFPEGVIPFFDLGNYTYLVIKSTPVSPDSVFWPGGKRL